MAGRKIVPMEMARLVSLFESSCSAFAVVLDRVSYSACIDPAYWLASPTSPKACERFPIFLRSGAIAPSDSCPNISVRSEVCSSFGLSAIACSTLKIVPCASFCMSFAICVAEKPSDWNAAA